MVSGDRVRRTVLRFIEKHPQVTIAAISCRIRGDRGVSDHRAHESFYRLMRGDALDMRKSTVEKIREALVYLARGGGASG
jgi:hypothetical protein